MLDTLREEFLPYLDYDQYSESMPGKEYTVRSVYYDTFNLQCYHEKANGIKERKKYRIRGYNNGGSGDKVFLEIKRKNNEFISKDRALIALHQVNPFLENKILFSDESDYKNAALKWQYHFHIESLSPTMLVVYDREAYQCKFGSGLRITFDKNLRSTATTEVGNLFSEPEWKYSLKDNFVLEVKFPDRLPAWLIKLLMKHNLQRTSVSKYLHSVEDNFIHRNQFNLKVI